MVTVPPMAAVRKARESSLQVKDARLFNLAPKDLTDMKAVTADAFKAILFHELQIVIIALCN